MAKDPESAGSGGSGGRTGSGSGGNSSAGTGGSGFTPDPGTPGARFPFPQNRAYPFCTPVQASSAALQTGYLNWKGRFVSGSRVVNTEGNNGAAPNGTVSEGQAYGMLLAVYMNDRTTFDALWAYAQAHKNGRGFMMWSLDANGNPFGSGGGNAATDADEDMAWALLMAASQWGGDYLNQAKSLIGAILTHEIESGTEIVKPGDTWGGSSQWNPSYFAPSYYRVFRKVTDNARWDAVVTKGYELLARLEGTHGLVPDWATGDGQRHSAGPNYSYDASRTPWRIALDYCENGSQEALRYVKKIGGFMVSKGITNIYDKYNADGTPVGDVRAGMAFFGPGGIAAMAGSDATFARTVYNELSALGQMGRSAPAGIYTYFHATMGAISMLTLSGNFFDYSKP